MNSPAPHHLNADAFDPKLGAIDSEELTRREKLTRIFQIGFNKCGTRSLYRFLQRNGIHSAHFNRGMLAQRIQENIDGGRKPLFGRKINAFVGYTDLQRITFHGAIEAATFYRQFFEYYPNSYFILNTRDKDGWLASRKAHGAGNYINRYRVALGLPDEASVLAYWSDQWDQHHEEVQSFFKDKPGRLIVYDIKTDHPQKMVDFLAPDFFTLPELFRHEGVTTKVDGESYRKNAPIDLKNNRRIS